MIYTHVNPDLDAVSSIWAVKKFIPGYADHPVSYVNANWNGAGMTEADIAVDIEAGGRGTKGEKDADGRPHSCFVFIVNKHAPEEDRTALKSVIEFIDAQDSYGSAIKYLAPELNPKAAEILRVVTIGSIFRALQISYKEPFDVLEVMSAILDGMLEQGRNQLRAEAEADTAKILQSGKVAILRDGRHQATQFKLFDSGIRVIVYANGYDLGIFREGQETIRMDHPLIKAVVEKAGETREWYSHPTGFLYCRGSRKAPASTPSKVNPADLAHAAQKALDTKEETGDALRKMH